MKSKEKIGIILFFLAIIIALIGIGTKSVMAVLHFDIGTLADDAAANNDSFWNGYAVGDRADADTDVESKTQWICLSEKKATGVGKGNMIRCIIDINRDTKGEFYSTIYGGDDVSGDNDFNAKKLAYLAYAATVDPETGLIGAAGKYKHGPRNAFYYFFSGTDLEYLIGSFSLKREVNDWFNEAGKYGATVLGYADTYANSEVKESSADITNSSDSGAEVIVSPDAYGITYSYIGPFTITTNGSIDSVSITDGSNAVGVSGFANSVGGTINAISGIPTNGNSFYIATTATLVNTDIHVKINTTGSSGGGIVTNPATGEQSTGFIKARVIFIGKNNGQGVTVFRGDVETTSPSTGSAEFTAKNNLGRMLVQKVGAYGGNNSYENVRDFGFRVYYYNGANKNYLRINNSDVIMGQATIPIGGGTSYTANEWSATTIFTSGNGTVTIDNIATEYQYYIEETNTDATNYQPKMINATIQYGNSGESNLNISNNITGPITVQLKGANNVITKVKLVDYRKIGNLSIEKVDEDNYNTKLGNVEFKIRNKDTNRYVVADKISNGSYAITNPLNAYTANEANGTTFVTNTTTGKIVVNGLDVGNYEIIEKKNPNYGYTVLTNSISASISNGQTTPVIIKNKKQTGNMKIHKTDADNNQYALPGVSFKIKDSQGRYIIAVNTSGATQSKVTGSIRLGNMQTTTDTNKATQFITDNSGNIRIYNLLLGTYSVSEVSIGNNFGYVLADANITWVSNLGNGSKNTAKVRVDRQTSNNTSTSAGQTDNLFNTLTMKNKREYIKIKGYAWEDRVKDKNSTKDYKWQSGTEDKRLANVTVRLKNAKGTTLAQATTNTNGEYVFGNYDENKNAVKIKIDDLVGAYIEFEYNGMSYQSFKVDSSFTTTTGKGVDGINTVTKLTSDTNKATDSALRNNFNANYATISKGISSNTNGNKTYDIKYNTKNHESKVNYGSALKYGYQGQLYPISGTDAQYLIQATTAKSSNKALCTSLTPSDIRKKSVEEIGGLNLGVEEREMPDLAITQDMEKVEISLNDYTHTYLYSQRYENPDSYAGGDGFNVSVKFANKYLSNSYSREVYSSDIVYNKQSGNEGKLKVFVTYRIKLRNESTNLYNNIKTLSNYYDARYENVVVKDANGGTISSSTDNSYNQNGLKKLNIQLNQSIAHQKTQEITITYQLNNDAVNSILNNTVTLDSVTEITSYSTYSDSGYRTPYAGIDVDSAPDNVTPTNTDTFEDDTDRAPSLILNVKEGRIIQGKVWEDGPIADLLGKTGYDKERKGNGIYEANENIVNNVKVELMTIDDSGNLQLAKLYKKDNTVVDATTNTNGTGDYSLVGIIPSNYVLRYTYGDNSVICDSQGNVIGNVNIDNYKSTIYRGGNKNAVNAMTDYWYRGETSDTNAQRLSDAKDNEEFVNDRITEEEINYETATQSRGLTEISADTRKFDIKLDYDVNLDNISHYGEQLKFVFDNIDFGIVERPRQSLIVDKQVANVQIQLANGTNIISGDPRSQNLSGVKVLDDDVFIEIDNEVIQGATLKITYEISVDNKNCEIDYNDEDYYIYGTVPSGHANWKIATVVDMFDYLPEEVVLESNEGNNWERTYITDDMEGTLLSEEVFETVKGLQNIIHLKNHIFESMEPGSQKRDTSMVVTKQLSSTADDLTYENDVEIIRLKGRKPIDSIPGNYDPSTNTPNEADDDNVEVTITAPTGENRQYMLYGGIAISVLVIIGVGIIIIKRKVLKK